MKKTIGITFFIIGISLTSFSQTKHRFDEDIKTIKKYDNIYAPPKNPILFIGSSSIRRWPNPQKAFCKHVILDRGIGGSVVNEMIYYANDIIFPYHPKQLIIYVGENDIIDKALTPDSILNRIKRLYGLVRSKLPTIPIGYISIKPSPVLKQYWGKVKKTNRLIAGFLKNQPNTKFINIYPQMVTKAGKPRPELFQNDMLHMNEKGYKIWIKAIKPYLIK